MLSIHNLSCSRADNKIFSHLSFSVAPARCLQLVAPNGTGKTTLLKVLCGFIPYEGQARWQDEAIRLTARDYLRHVLYFGHENNLHPDLTASENLGFLAAVSGIATTKKLIHRALGQMGIRVSQTRCRYFSAGQKQRISLARLALTQAKIWYLDEPLTALDGFAKQTFHGLIMDHLETGGAVVMATHQAFELPEPHLVPLNLAAYA